MEINTGTKDIITKKAIGLCLLNSHSKSLYRKRILGTHINITIFCTYCIGSDHHTLDHLVRITFHYGTIHESSRVTFITITYYITDLLRLTCNL